MRLLKVLFRKMCKMFWTRKIENNHLIHTFLYFWRTRFAWSFPVTLSFETIQQKRYLMFLVVYREVISALLLQLVFTQLLLFIITTTYIHTITKGETLLRWYTFWTHVYGYIFFSLAPFLLRHKAQLSLWFILVLC